MIFPLVHESPTPLCFLSFNKPCAFSLLGFCTGGTSAGDPLSRSSSGRLLSLQSHLLRMPSLATPSETVLWLPAAVRSYHITGFYSPHSSCHSLYFLFVWLFTGCLPHLECKCLMGWESVLLTAVSSGPTSGHGKQVGLNRYWLNDLRRLKNLRDLASTYL